MPAMVQCPACHKQFSIKDEYVGKVGRCTACKAAFPMMSVNVTAAPASATSPSGGKASPKIGRFDIRGKLGAGAFGTVYRAFDPQLEREVALKVPQAGMLNTPQRVERFLREAKASAQLTHPNIVPVYDAGKDNGKFYIAAAFIAGKPLADAIPDGGIDPARAARIVAELGDALFYAHMIGIVHRDIKPANVMLDGDDRPHLMDFGLAAMENSTEKLTHDGAVLGTPSYMSPEQAEGQAGDAKAESDQYSLGVVLYELLTGKTPFEGPSQIVIHNVIHKDVPRPSTLRKDLPRDLETICLKAMAKRPQDRYTSCQAFARDLRRWLDGEPIQARPLGFVERVGRWARREPKLAAAAGVIMVLLATVAGLASWKVGALAADVWTERAAKSAALARSEQAEADLNAERSEHDATRQGGYFHQIALVEAALAKGDLLAPHRVLPGVAPENRGWEWNHLMLAAEGRSAAARIFGNRNLTVGVAFDAASRQLICANFGGIVQIFDLASGRQVREFELPGGWKVWGQSRLALSGDGERLVTVRAPIVDSGGGSTILPPPPNPKQDRPADEVAVWNVRTGQKLVTLKADLPPGPMVVSINTDGSRIALATGTPSKVALFDGKSGDRLREFDGCHYVRSLTFDPRGATLFAVDGGNRTEIENRQGTRMVCYKEPYTELADGVPVTKYRDKFRPETYTYSVSKTVCLPNAIKTWDCGAVEPKATLASRPTTTGLSLTPDGATAYLLGSSVKNFARPVSESKTTYAEVEKEKVVDGVAVKYVVKIPVTSRVTKMVTVQVHEGEAGVPIDDVVTGQEREVWNGVDGALAIAVHPEGDRVATVTSDSCGMSPVVKLWDAATKRLIVTLQLPPESDFLRIVRLTWSPDGNHLAGWGGDGRVVVWSAVGGRMIAQFAGLGGAVTSVAWRPDGQQLAAISECSGRGAAFTPDGKSLFAFSGAGVSGQRTLAGGCVGLFYTGNDQFVQAGTAIARSGFGGSLSVAAVRWDAALGTQAPNPKGVDQILAINADGSRMITHTVPSGGPVGEPPIVRDQAGAEIARLADFPMAVDKVEFRPDGKFVAVASSQWTPSGRSSAVFVFNADTGKIVYHQPNGSGVFAFHPSSSRFASATGLIMSSPFAPPVAPAIPKVSPQEARNLGNPFRDALAFLGDVPPMVETPQPKPAVPAPAPTPPPVPSPAPPLGPPPGPFPGPRAITPTVAIVDLATGKETHVLKDFLSEVEHLAFHPDGKQLAIVSNGLKLKDTETGQTTYFDAEGIGPLQYAPAGNRLVYVAKQQMIAPAMMHAPLPAHGPAPVPVPAPAPAPAPSAVVFQEPAPIANPAFPPPGPGVPSGPVFSFVKVLDPATRQVVGSTMTPGDVTALDISLNGELAAFASLTPPILPPGHCGPAPTQPVDRPPAIHLLRLETGTSLAVLHGHADRIACLAFAPTGDRLASAAADGLVRIWSLATVAKTEN